ncbi:ABC transporter ATP-binding protein [Blastopirellula marina]|uniref:Probable ABC-type transport protein, ATP-binding component n=1 Tax=Blastopirellula marina DSM 3645 TaxID=314230 RepID=A3ZTG6_9BACT|nr:ABC transporter ATP-binding protein [Blastopirellula marina]EAQ80227.1 probable ABC-type transport protein, ATP-binding component [Blastopirellula marina DSM 3645]
MSLAAISIENVSYSYGARRALNDLSLQIEAGEIFVFLGPNGGGKTTLFRLLSTLAPLQAGKIDLLGFDLASQRDQVRRRIGVVFQSPSLDKKLTVAENMRQQSALYGLSGAAAREAEDRMMRRLGVIDRAGDLAEQLSGGLRRRVELAKGMIHRPQLLLLDEPSTGLDPGARSSLWEYLQRIRTEQGVTIVLTTHLLEEAEKADRIAILDEGTLVALDRPAALKASVGGDSVTITTRGDVEALAGQLRQIVTEEVRVMESAVRFESADASQLAPRIMQSLGDQIESITFGKPTLEDVFIDKTGRQYWREEASDGK